jgi:hypothetical protein
MQKHLKYLTLLLIVLPLVFTTGCGSSSSSSQQGTLSVSLTDGPAAGFDAVNITVSKVRVHQSASASENDSGWSDITLDPPKKINLLDLTNGVLDSLGQTSLPAGHYTQLRLVLSLNTGTTIANSVITSGTSTEIPLFTPSAVQSGIKLINEFDVAPGQRVDLVLDFDALKSVVARGNGSFALMPVIRVTPMVLTGIDGFVDPALLSDNVLVSAEMNGTVARSTPPDPNTGEFFLASLATGSYDLVITANGHATAVLTGVPVSDVTSTAVVTMVSTSTEPISLPTSTMHSLSGTVTLSPADPTIGAYIDSKQTFTTGTTVTIKSTAADLLSGAYELSLPAGAPVLGEYGSGILPIVFNEQPDVAGKYAAEASATGYQAHSEDVDISIADVIQNFTLTPP